MERFDTAYLAGCQRRSILEADAVFAVSRFTEIEVADQFGREADLVPNGVDPDRFTEPDPHVGPRLRAALGVADEDVLVLSVGGFEPRKNSRRALAAFALAQATTPRLTWVVAGGSSLWDHSAYAAEIEADLARLPPEVARRVVRTGPMEEDDMTALYLAADVLLFPSLHEGFGLSVLEAMAADTVVIAPGNPPFSEYLDGDCAILVDPLSVGDIAGALVGLAGDPGRRAALAQSAGKRARTLTWSRSALIHLGHYAALDRRSRQQQEELRSHA